MSVAAIDHTDERLKSNAGLALEIFGRGVRKAYGERLLRLVLFGSQARGDAHADSDIDVAVVLDEIEDKAAERNRLADIAYEAIVETSAEVQAWPVSEREWVHPDVHRNPNLARAMRRDGLVIWSHDDPRPAVQGIALG